MKIIRFPMETNANVISRAFNNVFENHNIPKEQQKEAKTWRFVRQEVSKNMFPKITGRPIPIINRGFNPPREIVKMSFTKDMFKSIYPWNVKTDKLKFAHLKKILIKNEITIGVFKELVSVLAVKEPAIKKAIQVAMANQFGGF